MVYWSITDFKKTNVRFPRTKDLYKKIKKNLAPRSSVRQPELSSVVFLSIENRVRQLILGNELIIIQQVSSIFKRQF